jgi:threonine dehydratase
MGGRFVNPDAVEAMAQLTAQYLRRTPVVAIEAGSLSPVTLTTKLELLQHTGSFKPRGIYAKVLSTDVPASGIVIASGGNAGAAAAHAARRLGHRATVFMPETSPMTKVERLQRLGAEVHRIGRIYDDALAASAEFADASGAAVIHAYDQPEVVAGQGTIFAELEHQLAGAFDTVVVAVGGGGLIGGALAWFHGRVKVVAVEPERSQCLHAALAAQDRVEVSVDGVAMDSLGARMVGEHTWSLRTHLGGSVTVTDDAIVDAQRALWRELRIVAEPGGAAALAAVRSGAYAPAPGERVALLVCGGNCDPATVT